MQLVLNIKIEKNNLKMFVKKRVTSSPLNFISREKCVIAMNYYIIPSHFAYRLSKTFIILILR